jgi:hypothetical protein
MAAKSNRERSGHKHQRPGALRTVDVMPHQLRKTLHTADLVALQIGSTTSVADRRGSAS